MKSEWNHSTINDVCVLVTDGSHSSPKSVNDGKYMVSVKDFTDYGFDFASCRMISNDDYETLKRNGCVPQIDDILIGKDGARFFEDIIIYRQREKPALLSSIAILRCDKSKILPDFLYYVLRTPSFRQDVKDNYGSGSAIPRIILKDFKRMMVSYPSLEKQQAIISVLTAIDSKIQANTEINDNLAEQIKTICTAWLSDYAPFGGVLPDDWSKTPLSSIADFVSGYSYKGTELTESNIAMATIKNFDRKGGFKLDGYKEIVPSSKLKDTQHAELFDTLIAHTDLTQNAEVIGNAEPVMSKSGYSDIVFSMDLVKVVPKNSEVSKFLIAAILQDKRFKAHCLGYVNGTTVLHLSKKALPEYKLYLPRSMDELKPLDDIVTALYKKIASNISENTQLELLRNSLLPKLMSGEIDVSAVQL